MEDWKQRPKCKSQKKQCSTRELNLQEFYLPNDLDDRNSFNSTLGTKSLFSSKMIFNSCYSAQQL